MQKITILLLLCFACCAYSQEKDCQRFKDGTFKVIDPASKKVCIIKRDGKKQTERLEESAEEYSFDLMWIDDCTYTLTPTSSTLARNKDVKKIGAMRVKIVETKEASYVHNVTVENDADFLRVDEVFVIKKQE